MALAEDSPRPPHFFFDFIPWKPTDTWPRDRCGRAQLVLLPSLVDFLHLGADLYLSIPRVPFLFYYYYRFFLILFSGNRQIPGLATGAVGHSLFYSRR